ncbi:MAG: glycosyltransferase family 1 protein [Kiritimatiellia bacterium]
MREMVAGLLAAGSPHRFVLYYADADLPGTHRGRGGGLPARGAQLLWDHWALPRAAARPPGRRLVPAERHPAGVRTPAVVTVHDLLYFRVPEFPHREYLRPDILYMRAMIPRSLRMARAVACDSAWTMRDAGRLLRIPAARMSVIPLAPGAAFRRPDAPPPAEIRAKHGLRNPFFLYAGTRSVRKNIRVLFEAFARCHRDIPHDLVLTGGGGHVVVEDRAEDVLDRHGIRDRVKVLGLIPQADLAALYRAAEAFVFPSRYEGFGLPPLEAFACGCPVISSAATSLAEVVGGAALTFDPLSPGQLEGHLRAVAADPALRERLRTAGLARAATFRYEDSARALLSLLETAAG